MFKRILINNAIRILERVVPKKNNLWVLGFDDGGGVQLSGNVWYLYRDINEAHQSIEAVGVTAVRSTYDKAKSSGGRVVYADTLAAFWVGLRAKVFVISGEINHDTPNFSKFNTIKAHLFHGVPLKQIYYMSPKMVERYRSRTLRRRIFEALCRDVALKEYDFIAYTAPAFEEIMRKSFNNSNLFLTGQPRDDVFYKTYSRDKLLEKMNLGFLKGKYIVSYLPTFRDSTKADLNYFIFSNSEEYKKTLEKNGVFIIQKNHNSKVQNRVLDGPLLNLPNEVDTQELLLVSDALITDYSSVYIDFLHLKRPIHFFPYDLEDYMSKDRGLNFDYHNDLITPGPKARSEAALLDALLKNKADPNLFSNLRLASLDFYQRYQDGKASERVTNAILGLIKGK